MPKKNRRLPTVARVVKYLANNPSIVTALAYVVPTTIGLLVVGAGYELHVALFIST